MPGSCMEEEESPSAQTVQLCDAMEQEGTLKRGAPPPPERPGPKRQALSAAGAAQSDGAGDKMQQPDRPARPLPPGMPSQCDPFEGQIDDEFEEEEIEYAHHSRCAGWRWGAHTCLAFDAGSRLGCGFRYFHFLESVVGVGAAAQARAKLTPRLGSSTDHPLRSPGASTSRPSLLDPPPPYQAPARQIASPHGGGAAAGGRETSVGEGARNAHGSAGGGRADGGGGSGGGNGGGMRVNGNGGGAAGGHAAARGGGSGRFPSALYELTPPSSLSGCLGAPIWWARGALERES